MQREEEVDRYAGSFIIFENKFKNEDKHPDYVGYYTDLKGDVWRLAGWKKQAKSGRKFMSGKITLFKKKGKRVSMATKIMDDLPI